MEDTSGGMIYRLNKDTYRIWVSDNFESDLFLGEGGHAESEFGMGGV